MSVITLSQLKTYIGEEGSTNDSKLQLVVDGVDDYIKTYTGRLFGSTATVTDEVHDYAPTIWLNNMDITEITAVKEGRGDTPTTLDADAYFYNTDGRLVLSTTVAYNPTKLGHDYIRVTYTHGVATAPNDVVLAALQLGGDWFNGIDGDLTEESIGSYRLSYTKTLSHQRISRVLSGYKRMRV